MPHAYGIDFVGGQIQEYRFSKPVSSDAVRASLKENGVEEAVIQQFDKNPENVIIRTSEDTAEKVQAAFEVLADADKRQAYDDNRKRNLLDSPIDTAREIWQAYFGQVVQAATVK